jgi:hypothetical protein
MLESKRKFKIYEKKERGLILHLRIELDLNLFIIYASPSRFVMRTDWNYLGWVCPYCSLSESIIGTYLYLLRTYVI